MSAPSAVPTSQATSKTNSFESRRTSSTSSQGAAAELKQDAGFKGFAKKVYQHAKDHHKSVRAAHRAYYGFP